MSGERCSALHSSLLTRSSSLLYAIFQFGAAIRTSAVDAAEDPALFFDAVADDPAAAVRAGRGQRLYGALETIEYVRLTAQGNLEALVVVVSADFALSHINNSSRDVAAPRG
jgi:hypothetical protein